MRKTFAVLCLIVLILLLLIVIFFTKNKSRDTYTILRTTPPAPDPDDDPIPDSQPPMYDDKAYTFFSLFQNSFPFRYTDSFGIDHTPHGNGQVIAIVSTVWATWSSEGIVRAMLDSGITNMDAADISSQIIQVDATTIEQPFDWLTYTNLTVPLSDGTQHRVRDEDVTPGSQLLQVALQCLFTALPNVKVVIFYYGSNPDVCPPDGDPQMDIYEQVIMRLYNTIESFPIFKIFCNTFIIEDHGNNMIQFVRGKLLDMKRRGVQIITTTGEYEYEPGDDMRDFETFPPGCSEIIRVGGLLKLFNSLPSVYINTIGGYFTIDDYVYENSSIPYFQVGYVSPALPGQQQQEDQMFVGCPDAAGYIGKVRVILGARLLSTRVVRNMAIAAYAYSVIIAMVNEISNESSWNYQQLFYRFHYLLFDYVSSGRSIVYNASDYRVWNPCTGLGILDGNRLASLLSNKYILTAYPTQLSSLTISEPMSYVNFFPLSPVTDPNNDPDPGKDNLRSQPVFGPQSIWSEMYIYVVSLDPQSNMMMIPKNYSNQIVKSGDTIVIASSQSRSTAWAMSYVNGQLQMTTHNIRPGILIPWEFLWTIDTANTRDSYIRINTAVRISPYSTNRRSYLTSRYIHQSPSIVATSSLPDMNDTSVVFTLLPHAYHLIESDYNDTTTPSSKGIQKSYFVNLTNKDDFMTCGFDVQATRTARDLASSSQAYAQFERKFDPVPQWLMVPAHPISTKNMNVGLTFGRFMFFNTRCQAYLYLEQSEDRQRRVARLVNVNHTSAPVSMDIYNWAVFHIRSSVDGTSDIFKRRVVPMEPYNYFNDFLTTILITFESPYFSNSSVHSYRFYMSESPRTINNDDGTVVKHVQFVATAPPKENVNIFLIQENIISTVSGNVFIKPTFVLPANRRFANCVISATNANDYVGMVPYDRMNTRQRWECVPSPSVRSISNTFHPFVRYIIVQFDGDYDSGVQFQNYQFPGMFLIHCEGGWKPRLGNTCPDDTIWTVSANYFNSVPGTSSELSLSANYFYLNAVYFFSCRRGTLSPAMDVPHVPSLLTHTDNPRYHASSFIIFSE